MFCVRELQEGKEEAVLKEEARLAVESMSSGKEVDDTPRYTRYCYRLYLFLFVNLNFYSKCSQGYS